MKSKIVCKGKFDARVASSRAVDHVVNQSLHRRQSPHAFRIVHEARVYESVIDTIFIHSTLELK